MIILNFMSKKIDIREIHNNFEHLLFERDSLLSSDSDSTKINDIDLRLRDILISGFHSGIAFSDRMNDWKPSSEKLLFSLENDLTIQIDNHRVTFYEALDRKIEKERKFKSVQNWSMFICTILLFLYYGIVGWLI